MKRYIPKIDELFTIIYRQEIESFFKEKKNRLGFDFFGMAERSPYGSMFASSDPSVANLMYANNWYSGDPAINRDILLLAGNATAANNCRYQLHQSMWHARRVQCGHVGSFTIPVIMGETEIYFCVAVQSSEEKSQYLQDQHWDDLINIGLEFRAFMQALANPRFGLPQKTREMHTYYIVDNIAFEGKEAFVLSGLERADVEIARFHHRVGQMYRIISKNFIGFSFDIAQAMEEKLTGGQVSELIIVESPLMQDFKKSIFVTHCQKDIFVPSQDLSMNVLLNQAPFSNNC